MCNIAYYVYNMYDNTVILWPEMCTMLRTTCMTRVSFCGRQSRCLHISVHAQRTNKISQVL